MNLPNVFEENPRPKIKIYNINLEEKYVLLTPPRTGSRRSLLISERLNFNTYKSVNGVLEFHAKGTTHNHTHDLFNGHEEFKIIMTCRNPYSVMVTEFKHSLGTSETIKTNFNLHSLFSDFIYDFYETNASSWYSPTAFRFREELTNRKIDYRIRLENMFEDYCKVPLIKDSEIYFDGTLKSLTDEVIGSHLEHKNLKHLNNLPKDFRDYYNKESSDFMKSKFYNLFEFMDYDMDSWNQ